MTQRGTVQYKLIGALVALAAALASSLAKAEQWCPGQPWSLEWGANLDYEACHETPLPNDTDLDHLGPIDWGATPVAGDGNHVDMSGVSTGNAGSSGDN